MSYHHLTISDRIRIEVFHKEGLSAREIGKRVGRHHSTISRELKRSENQNYEAEAAQAKYIDRRKACKSIGKYSKALAECIEEALYRTYSPEQIANTITKGILSFKTIYRWIYQGLLTNGNLTVLRHKGKRHKPKETRNQRALPYWKNNIKTPQRSRKKNNLWSLGVRYGCF